ncbi:HIG1 domain-containing protein [Hyphomonas sp.]
MTGFYVALAALVVVLGIGIANIARTDDKQASRSNKLMRLRIMIQAIVIVLLVALGVTLGAVKIGF